MSFKDLNTLLVSTANWLDTDIPEARLNNDADGRKWFLSSIRYDKTLTLADLKEATNRDKLNEEFDKRYKDTSASTRKGISALKTEISALYSFNKCFVQRYKGRMHFYRDDLSQKATRTVTALGQSHALLEEFANNLSE
jgi:hypothetical protein